ncbi:hypothetical protein PR202_ga03385 [Eleusine coracana subsp. coracana]|uniref:DUF6817 domain-containing protein n=1 Tax=Eleusine coracana subsp. coracana TaxID=191504 RepID=A0AAV5BPQ4_ELECO|nr:hypothetical protein QOZ80_2AG0151360 [Eleusine coracana subsp. coracana]GJM87432.1 hypothetical protein PR202_ga03385 [Eleusine coracana subsp. coracana]
MAPHTSKEEDKEKEKDKNLLEDALVAARPFLRGEEEQVDPALPRLTAVLRAAGAGECWHKHGTFLAHLLDVYRILRLWGSPEPVARCGLYHSSYSNSYVNLAIFDPGTGRDHVASVVGAAAERLVHLFCIVPRQQLIHDDLLFHYTDQDLVADLASSEASLNDDPRLFNNEEPWRRKIQRLLPPNGITVKHIRTGEDVSLSRRVAATFLLMTMADFSDQLFDWQDRLFDNTNGRLEFRGNKWTSLWPGTGKPGLWVSSISRMGALYNLIVREEQIYNMAGNADSRDNDDDLLDLVIPPVFDGCTKVLDADHQKAARDLYWEAVCNGDDAAAAPDQVEHLLKQSIANNPFVGEPHLVLAQVYLNMERYDEAQTQAEQGLKLLLDWGTSWDKRMSWEGWVSWARAMLIKAQHKDWPHTSFGIISLGLVK